MSFWLCARVLFLGLLSEAGARAMSRKKVSTTIYITPEQADRLKLLHDRTKVPIAVYIREGIDMVLKHYDHMLPGQMSLEVQRAQGLPSDRQGLPSDRQSAAAERQSQAGGQQELIDSVPPPAVAPKR